MKEIDVNSGKAIVKIHRTMNHKKVKQMEYTSKNARRLDGETRKLNKEVVENCEFCQKNGRSNQDLQ